MDVSTNEKAPTTKGRIKFLAERINVGRSSSDGEFPFHEVDTGFVQVVLEEIINNPAERWAGDNHYKTANVDSCIYDQVKHKDTTVEFLRRFLNIVKYGSVFEDISYGFKLETNEEGIPTKNLDLSVLDLLTEPADI